MLEHKQITLNLKNEINSHFCLFEEKNLNYPIKIAKVHKFFVNHIVLSIEMSQSVQFRSLFGKVIEFFESLYCHFDDNNAVRSFIAKSMIMTIRKKIIHRISSTDIF